MVIERLELADFRNFAFRELAFSHNRVLFTGPNGSGKTNALESIAFLSLLRSFRNAPARELIRLGAKHFTLKADIQLRCGKEKLAVREHLSGQRELFIGRAAVRKSSDFIREFHCVIFSPEDRLITGGSSGHRRKFFDILISTIEPEYLYRLARYSRALMQRNKALKSNPAMAKMFEPELAEQVSTICSKRQFFAGKTVEIFNRISDNKYDFNISYRPDYPSESDGFLEHLEKTRKKETERCCTLSGPQRDEFVLTLNGKELRVFGSTGQIGISSLLLKMTEFELVKNLIDLPVIALIDDVTGELDRQNCDLFLDIIKSADQRFFTFSKEENIPELSGIQRIDL